MNLRIIASCFLIPFFLLGCTKEDAQETPSTQNPVLPTVEAFSATEIESLSAVLNGEVKDEGTSAVYSRGFCWSLTTEPTVNNDFSLNNFGPGIFDHKVEDLDPNFTYYVRAYATNSSGTVYSNEITFNTKNPVIGTEWNGGIVAYIDGTGEHGFIVSKDNLGPTKWGCNGIVLNNLEDTQIGSGKKNTENIISQCAETYIAAQLCADYKSGGYDDWYLPSYDELYQIYVNRVDIGTDFSPNFPQSVYWSSSQFNITPASGAKGINFDNYDPNIGAYFKFNGYYIRAIKYF